MALKIMSCNAMDQQFIADNLLTDEDFQFDTGEEFDLSFEDQNILQAFSNDIQMHENALWSNNDSCDKKVDACPEFNNFLVDYVLNTEFKFEPQSPSSSEVSYDNEISVITIPEVSPVKDAPNILVDTPPHTPNGVDYLPDSPLNCNVEPLVMSVNSVNGITYVLPQNIQAVMNPTQYLPNKKPKKESNTKIIAPKADISLTPVQMEKFAKGALQIRPPPNIVSSLCGKSNASLSETPRKTSSKINSPLSDLEVCAAALKRQKRILRNRESAYQSRIKKKEYVQKLEAELNCVTAENSSLKEENSRLKSRVSDLEKEIQKLKTAFSPKSVKKTMGLMVVICMLTLNFAPYSTFFEKTALKPLTSNQVDHRFGRVLLWSESNSTEENKDSTKFSHKSHYLKREIKKSYDLNFDPSFNSSTCQQFINKTESLRLENDLLGWVERVEKKQKQSKMKKRKFHMDATLPYLATWSKRKTELNKDIWARRKNKNEILIYETPRKAYEDFFEAIHRRDDTFYFVSFSGDHLLLPAIAHNKTLRPRMSFVMPAMTLNESVGDSDDHVSMMQIDCEVMDTKLVYIKESVIPEHLRQKSNNSTKSQSKNSEDRHQKRLQFGNKLIQKSLSND